MFSGQWAKLQEQVFKAFGGHERAPVPTPMDEMSDLKQLIESGAFIKLDEEDRRNEACRIGRLGADNSALGMLAVKLLTKLLRDPDNIVRWDAAYGLIEIARVSEPLKIEIFPVLQKVKRTDPDPELRAMVSIELNCFGRQRPAP